MQIESAVRGHFHNLSDATYVILADVDHVPSYKAGTRVRLIDGIDNSKTPGFHFKDGFVTVCRCDSMTAEFVGVPLANLQLINAEQTHLYEVWEDEAVKHYLWLTNDEARVYAYQNAVDLRPFYDQKKKAG